MDFLLKTPCLRLMYPIVHPLVLLENFNLVDDFLYNSFSLSGIFKVDEFFDKALVLQSFFTNLTDLPFLPTQYDQISKLTYLLSL